MVFLLAAMKNPLNPDGSFLAGASRADRVAHLPRLASFKVMLLALFTFASAWTAGASSAASDGDGTMTVLPTSVTPGSTTNSFTFSFRDTNDWVGIPDPQATLTIPAGWTAPQSINSGNPGYVTVTKVGGGANSASLTSISGSGPWTVTVTFNVAGPTPEGFDISYAGVTAPTTAGVDTFTTQSKTSGGTLTPIKSDNGYVNIVVNGSVTGTNSIAEIVGGNPTTLRACGIPGYNYIAERATNLSPAIWVDVSTNTAATNGVINVNDNFNDLGGNAPSSAFYRLKWQP